ncbi:hypothetical protein ZOSMA_202G00520 [Zostera marina]|uniref:Uncharacterized protein n=1 Tax=Zostera marina TaxID=29655 RepID=A0A0K9PNZ7_ZOSMR|nr:hypothetical protein ZOSMA_202G00520 [Zostera marina]
MMESFVCCHSCFSLLSSFQTLTNSSTKSRRSLTRRRLFTKQSSTSTLRVYGVKAAAAVGGGGASVWDEKPFEVLRGGKISYFDEQDVVCFLDPPKELIPIDPHSYNPAAFLWKKIGDIPEERRHRLLHLLNARLVSKLWQSVGTRYEDGKLTKKTTSSILSMGTTSITQEQWFCKTSSGPMPVPWLNNFRKVMFRAKDGCTYGRLIVGGSLLTGVANSFSPLYFTVTDANEVMATEQPCDLSYEFGDGVLDIQDYPDGFPKPAKHPWPFNDDIVIYIRHAGPGVVVGQAWQEGIELDQLPKQFCGDILMVKDYISSTVE